MDKSLVKHWIEPCAFILRGIHYKRIAPLVFLSVWYLVNTICQIFKRKWQDMKCLVFQWFIVPFYSLFAFCSVAPFPPQIEHSSVHIFNIQNAYGEHELVCAYSCSTTMAQPIRRNASILSQEVFFCPKGDVLVHACVCPFVICNPMCVQPEACDVWHFRSRCIYQTSNEKYCREGKEKEDGKRRRMRTEKNEKSISGLRGQKRMRTRRGWRKTRGAPSGNAMCSMLLVEQEKSMLF